MLKLIQAFGNSYIFVHRKTTQNLGYDNKLRNTKTFIMNDLEEKT